MHLLCAKLIDKLPKPASKCFVLCDWRVRIGLGYQDDSNPRLELGKRGGVAILIPIPDSKVCDAPRLSVALHCLFHWHFQRISKSQKLSELTPGDDWMAKQGWLFKFLGGICRQFVQRALGEAGTARPDELRTKSCGW
jgi:hypothetical protein